MRRAGPRRNWERGRPPATELNRGLGLSYGKTAALLRPERLFGRLEEWHPTFLSSSWRGTIPGTAFGFEVSRGGLAQALEQVFCRNFGLGLGYSQKGALDSPQQFEERNHAII